MNIFEIRERIKRNEDAIDYLENYPHYQDEFEKRSKITYHQARILRLKERLEKQN